MLLITPIIILCKSEKLNDIILFLQHVLFSVINIVVLILNMIVSAPVLIVICMAIKIKNFPKYSKGALDKFLRIVDIILLPFLIPPTMPIMIYTSSMSNLVNLYSIDYYKMAAQKKEEFEYINKLVQQSAAQLYLKHIGSETDSEMVKNIPANLEEDVSFKYFLFKRFLNQGRTSNSPYDPSENMIVDTFAYVVVGITKMLRAKLMEKGTITTDPNNHSIPFFIPADYMVKEMARQFRTTQAVQAMIFGATFQPDFDFHSQGFDDLIEALADESLGGINTENDEGWNEDISDDILLPIFDIIAITAPLTSHSLRKKFWRKKLTMLLLKGEKQWILDQFNFCKILLMDNCIEISTEEYEKKASKEEAVKLDFMNDFEIDPEAETMQVFNSTSLVADMTVFEKMARKRCKADFEANDGAVSKKLINALKKETPFKVKRFLSSGFAYTNKAWHTFQSE